MCWEASFAITIARLLSLRILLDGVFGGGYVTTQPLDIEVRVVASLEEWMTNSS